MKMRHEQLAGSAGGPILRRHKRGSSAWLTIMRIDPAGRRHLGSFCSALFEHESRQIKLIGNLYDLCNSLLLQLVEFLGSFNVGNKMYADRYQALIPNIDELVDPGNFGMDPDIAFSLGRPLIAAANVDVFGGGRREKDEDGEGEMNDGEGCDGDGDVCENMKPWQLSSDEMVTTCGLVLPPNSDEGKVLSKSLYEIFWSLKSYDIYFPETRYADEQFRLKSQVEGLSKKKPEGEKEARNLKAEIRAINGVIAKLEVEQKDQKEHVEFVRNHVDGIKGEFLSDLNADLVAQNFSHSFITLCIYPRCLFSPEDAQFCR